MTLRLPSILKNTQRIHHPFVLVQSSACASALSLLQEVANVQSNGKGRLVILCALCAPSIFLDHVGNNDIVIDWTADIPGFCGSINTADDRLKDLEGVLESDSSSPLTLVVDSVDTLLDDFESLSATSRFISSLLKILRSRTVPSRLVCHIKASSRLLPILKDVSFSPTLIHLITYPPVLLSHISTAFLTPPPSSFSEPAPSLDKFWRIFIPISERHQEIEDMVFRDSGESAVVGVNQDNDDIVIVEIITRGGAGISDVYGETRRKTVERTLEAWTKGTACAISSLDIFQSSWSRRHSDQETEPDPSSGVSFNLNLTPAQQEARASVPLPYAHETTTIGKPPIRAEIFYNPDSADDLDDEDPDEDLDI